MHQLKYLGYLKLIGSGYNWCHWSPIRWDPCGALNLDVQDVYANGCTVNGTVHQAVITESDLKWWFWLLSHDCTSRCRQVVFHVLLRKCQSRVKCYLWIVLCYLWHIFSDRAHFSGMCCRWYSATLHQSSSSHVPEGKLLTVSHVLISSSLLVCEWKINLFIEDMWSLRRSSIRALLCLQRINHRYKCQ